MRGWKQGRSMPPVTFSLARSEYPAVRFSSELTMLTRDSVSSSSERI
jgi:hypothetical protein